VLVLEEEARRSAAASECSSEMVVGEGLLEGLDLVGTDRYTAAAAGGMVPLLLLLTGSSSLQEMVLAVL